MKNICFIDYDFSVFGGVEKVLKDLAESLLNDYDVHVMSICSKEKATYYNIDKRIHYYAVCDSKPRIRKAITSSFKVLKKYIKQNNIDVVFIMGYFPIPVLLPLVPFVKAKFVFCDHGAIENQLDDKKVTIFRKIGAQFFDKTVTLTQKNLNDYKKYFKTKDKKLECIYNSIDDKIFDYTPDEYNMNSKKIITAGRFTKEKGFDMLVDVAKLVFDKHPDWCWDLYGDGEELEEIKKKAFSLGLEGKLIFKGMVKNIYELYKDYAMYVLPSYREGLPLVLLEAKANKLPIVSFDVVTGPSEIITNGIDGYLIECYNKQEMADKICKLIEDQDLRKEFSDNSQNNLDKFSKDTILKKWCDLIENL